MQAGIRRGKQPEEKKLKEDSPAQCRYEDSDKPERNPPSPALPVPAGQEAALRKFWKLLAAAS